MLWPCVCSQWSIYESLTLYIEITKEEPQALKIRKSDIFAIIKQVMEHYFQQLTHVHPPGFTLAGTLQASRHAKTPEFLKYMFQEAHNPERVAIFIFI